MNPELKEAKRDLKKVAVRYRNVIRIRKIGMNLIGLIGIITLLDQSLVAIFLSTLIISGICFLNLNIVLTAIKERLKSRQLLVATIELGHAYETYYHWFDSAQKQSPNSETDKVGQKLLKKLIRTTKKEQRLRPPVENDQTLLESLKKRYNQLATP